MSDISVAVRLHLFLCIHQLSKSGIRIRENDSSTMPAKRKNIKYFNRIRIFGNSSFFPLTADFISRTFSVHS